VIEFLKIAGANIIVLDLNDKRLEFCRKRMGVCHVIQADGKGGELKELDRITDGALPADVFDATGNVHSMSNAFQYVGHAGRLVFVGIVTADVSFSDPLFHAREMTLYASRNAMPEDFDRIIELIEKGQLDTQPWITHRTGFDSLIEDFPSFTKPETGVIKAIVEVG